MSCLSLRISYFWWFCKYYNLSGFNFWFFIRTQFKKSCFLQDARHFSFIKTNHWIFYIGDHPIVNKDVFTFHSGCLLFTFLHLFQWAPIHYWIKVVRVDIFVSFLTFVEKLSFTMSIICFTGGGGFILFIVCWEFLQIRNGLDFVKCFSVSI